jgi:hypothetical protein
MSGTVFDQHDRAVVRATVGVVDQLNATSQTTQTNEDGYFMFAQLRPGKYTLSERVESIHKRQRDECLTVRHARLYRVFPRNARIQGRRAEQGND